MAAASTRKLWSDARQRTGPGILPQVLRRWFERRSVFTRDKGTLMILKKAVKLRQKVNVVIISWDFMKSQYTIRAVSVLDGNGGRPTLVVIVVPISLDCIHSFRMMRVRSSTLSLLGLCPPDLSKKYHELYERWMGHTQCDN